GAALDALRALAPGKVEAALADAEQSSNPQVKDWAARARAAAKAPPRPRRTEAGPPPPEHDWFRHGERVNLLRLPGTRPPAATAPLGGGAGGLRARTADAPATVAVATPTATGLDVVYEFPGVVAPERLLVRLPAHNPPGAAAGRVEVLASTVSAHAGFQALR